MRSLLWKTLVAASFVVAVGCGDDDGSGGTGASGGSEDGAGGSGAGDGAGGTGAGTTDGAGGTGGGGAPPGDCIEITPDSFYLYANEPPDFWIYETDSEALAGALPDYLDFWIFPSKETPIEDITGEVDLAAGDNASWLTCSTCLNLLEDFEEGVGSAKQYFQASGTADYGDTTAPFPTVTFTDVTLVESEEDAEGNLIPVDGGTCLHIAEMTVSRPPPPDTWTCDENIYDADDACDCDCGAADPDCDNDVLPSTCIDGQTCSDEGACEGDPTGWTCAGRYGDGTCDCGCSNAAGLVDSDCANALIASCGTCNSAGSCSANACPGSIDPVDNSGCVL